MAAIVDYITANWATILWLTWQHITIVGVAVGLAVVTGIPLGIAAAQNRRFASVVLYTATLIMTTVMGTPTTTQVNPTLTTHTDPNPTLTTISRPAVAVELTAPDSTRHRHSPSGTDYVHTFDSGKPGPHVLVNALTHGN